MEQLVHSTHLSYYYILPKKLNILQIMHLDDLVTYRCMLKALFKVKIITSSIIINLLMQEQLKHTFML